uniref:PIN domain-containing protein n=1 Tax=mine drainage metagenome TaxID=410659 RepID=E6QN69_9ZZZZ
MTLEEHIFSRHKGRRVLLDSNLLLVLVTGNYDTRLLGTFKRIQEYTSEDHELLVWFVGKFRILVTTPHVLTEVSNLANGLSEWVKTDWAISFASFLQSSGVQSIVEERWDEGSKLALTPEFVKFGITDSAVSAVATEALVLTEDYRLSGWLRSRRVDVLNFRDLRDIQHAIRKLPHD